MLSGEASFAIYRFGLSGLVTVRDLLLDLELFVREKRAARYSGVSDLFSSKMVDSLGATMVDYCLGTVTVTRI